METSVMVFPVLPGKDAREVAKVVLSRPEEYKESRRRLGVHVERAWEQATPAGTVVIAYIESEEPFGDAMAKIAQSDLAIDRDFLAALADVHGFDPSQPAPGDPPELLAEWIDEAVGDRRPAIAFCAPIRPDAAAAARSFAKEAWSERRAELAASRRALGISREAVMLNHTPAGDMVCVYLEGEDPVEGNRKFAESRTSFDTWFKDRCRQIFVPEVDFNQPVPPVNSFFDSLAI